MRISAASRTVTNLPTAARGPGVFAGATGGAFRLREVGVFNTSTTAVNVGLAVCTATGTQVDGLTEYILDDPSNGNAPAETAFKSQSSDSTVAAVIRQASLGAAVGSGLIWTFGDAGVLIAEGTANGVIVTCPNGTAQHLDFYFDWEK
jgi:hypothetical protein